MTNKKLDFTGDAFWAYPLMDALSRKYENVVFRNSFVSNVVAVKDATSPVIASKGMDVEWLGGSKADFPRITQALKEAIHYCYGDRVYVDDAATEYIDGTTNVEFMRLRIKRREDEGILFYIGLFTGGYFPYPDISGHILNYNFLNYSFRGKTPLYLMSNAVRSVSAGVGMKSDMLEVYRLSLMSGWTLSEIHTCISKLPGSISKLGDFGVFKEYRTKRTGGVFASYSRWRTVKNKPEFDELHSRVNSFLSPFIHGTSTKKDGMWVVNDSKHGVWLDPNGELY